MTFNASINIDTLIGELDMRNEKIAVEINKVIVPRSQYQHYSIQAHDEIEIVRAVGGG